MNLVVTSPLTATDEAREAQKRLKENRFDDFLEGPVDRVWGPECRRATLRGKFWCGYAKAALKPVYGDAFHAYLGGRELTAAMKERRKERLADQRVKIRRRALEIAKGQLGTEERPAGSNKQKYGEWYGANGQPWCFMFVSWCYAKAFEEFGVTGFAKKGSRYSFCPFGVSASIQGQFGLDQRRDPEPGDIVFYQFDADSNADHVGLFEKWTDKGQSFSAIEGNTAEGNDANGGKVQRRLRSIGLVYRPRTGGRSFVRVSPTSE